MFRIIVLYPGCEVSIRARTTAGTPTLRCNDFASERNERNVPISDWDWSFGCLLVPSNHKCAAKALESVKLPLHSAVLESTVTQNYSTCPLFIMLLILIPSLFLITTPHITALLSFFSSKTTRALYRNPSIIQHTSVSFTPNPTVQQSTWVP